VYSVLHAGLTFLLYTYNRNSKILAFHSDYKTMSLSITIEDENIQMAVVPPNTNSLLQPLDQGIVNSRYFVCFSLVELVRLDSFCLIKNGLCKMFCCDCICCTSCDLYICSHVHSLSLCLPAQRGIVSSPLYLPSCS
jgi:hypothetical protein